MIKWLIIFTVIYYLIKKIKKIVSLPPLAKACWNGNFEIVKQMIENGYDVNERDDHRRTPLMCLMGTSHVEIVKYLLEHGADTSLVDDSGKNVWHHLMMNAASTKDTCDTPFKEIYMRHADLLLKYKANKYINEKDKEGKIPLIYLFNGFLIMNPYILTILMLVSGTNAKLQDFTGRDLAFYIDRCSSLSNSDKGRRLKMQLINFCSSDMSEVEKEYCSLIQANYEP